MHAVTWNMLCCCAVLPAGKRVLVLEQHYTAELYCHADLLHSAVVLYCLQASVYWCWSSTTLLAVSHTLLLAAPTHGM
jgi:hypothetical protein